MSYEGYNQNLCSEGHYWTSDAYEFKDDVICLYCEKVSKPVWSNSVDDTNGESVGHIDMNQFLLHKEVKQRCNLGCMHIVKHAIYRIPTKEETKGLRTFTDPCSGEIFPETEYNKHYGIEE